MFSWIGLCDEKIGCKADRQVFEGHFVHLGIGGDFVEKREKMEQEKLVRSRKNEEKQVEQLELVFVLVEFRNDFEDLSVSRHAQRLWQGVNHFF